MDEKILNFFKDTEGILALIAMIGTILSVLFSAKNLFSLKNSLKDKEKKLEILGDSNIVYNKEKGEITIKDKSESILNNEIVVENVKPTEIFINNHYHQENLPNDKIGKSILIGETINYENHHLSNYYKQTLFQSQTSFWFSLIFASIGFLLIILASILHVTNSLDKTVITIVSGVVIEAISALFFVQSNNAKKAVTNFFEKLRKDKQIQDAIKISESIEDKTIKDKLKVKLSLSLIGQANIEESIKEITE
jgi:hypothetical protein